MTRLLLSLTLLLLLTYTATNYAQQPAVIYPIINPDLPDEVFSKNEKLIRIPKNGSQLSEEQKILHLLNRAGFGARPGDIDRIRKIGIDQYLEQQLHPEDITDSKTLGPLARMITMQMTTGEIFSNYGPPPPPPKVTPTPTPAPAPAPALATASVGLDTRPRTVAEGQMEQQMPAQENMVKPTPTPTPEKKRDGNVPMREQQQAKLLRAVFSDKQLLEVMSDFWFNHFNVYIGKDNARWTLISYERDTIRPHALGKFKDMLTSVAYSPAMMIYLDNFQSQAVMTPKNDKDGIPVSRPIINENYARELLELHTLGVDGGYTQKDILEIARCFTGWSITSSPNLSFQFKPKSHDRGEKIVLGKRIAAGGGIEDGLRVLDILSRHPATAKFIARKLVMRFVADEPPASLITRAADTFTRTDGDIREVVRTILTSQEFYSPLYYRNKIKSPLEVVASALRATGSSTDGAQPVTQWITRMGGPLYGCTPPTGYSEDSSQWMSNSTLVERVNFAPALISNNIKGTKFNSAKLIEPDAELKKDKLIDQLIAVLIHSDVTKKTRDNLEQVYEESKNTQNQKTTMNLAVLILGSREFQIK